MSRRRKGRVGEKVNINASCSTPETKRSGKLYDSKRDKDIYFKKALCDLRASINLMPLSIYE
ncbi:gag-asp_proteas domain-containing protein [Gossypium australe]|uniref:Gag-asp_proteas domain-containing protein n=1 Tax=Gossypium australe TaxID=47621 RepID=A0A5B6VXB7_9ROSI|nr:gag-asp_proteas domain-containing protein [Gossypium australe]